MIRSDALKSLKNLLIYVAIRAALAVAALFPLALARRVGAALGALGWRLARRERTRALGAAAGALGSAEGAAAARASFRALGVSAAEAARLDALRRCFDRAGERGPVRLAAEDAGRLEAALAGGRGVVYVTAHLGNWELMAAYLAWRGFPISTVARASYDPRLTRLIDGWRAASGVQAILRDRTNGAAVARGCFRALRAGRVLGLLLDQDLGEGPSVTVPFLGRPARVALGPAELALRSGAAVVGGFIGRTPDDPAVHRICITSIPVERDAGATALAIRMTGHIEKAVLERPGEWVWMHDRWRGADPGAAPLAGDARLGNSNFRADSTRVALQP